MAHFYFHSISSAREYGGVPSDYYALHAWYDSTKQNIIDARHRILLHNLGGVALSMKIFGDSITVDNTGTKTDVSVYALGLQHITEDFGRVIYAEEILEYCSVYMSKKLLGFNVQEATIRMMQKHKGGTRSDYQPIVDFFSHFMYWAHTPETIQTGLAFFCNSFGIFQLERLYGPTWIRPSDGKVIPTRIIGENYVHGGYGIIPNLNDVLVDVPQKSWMHVNAAALSVELDDENKSKSNPPRKMAPTPLPH